MFVPRLRIRTRKLVRLQTVALVGILKSLLSLTNFTRRNEKEMTLKETRTEILKAKTLLHDLIYKLRGDLTDEETQKLRDARIILGDLDLDLLTRLCETS